MSSPTRARIAALGLFVANVAYMVGVFTPMIGPDADGPFNLAPLLATPLLLAPFGLLMLRPTDRHAWLLALMCSGFFVFIGRASPSACLPISPWSWRSIATWS